MASATFIYMCKLTSNKPVRQFIYDGTDYSDYIISIPDIQRVRDLSAGTMSIELDNIDGTWDVFLSDHTELTKQVNINMSFGGFVNNADTTFVYTADTIAFNDNGASPDTITDSGNNFLNYNFVAGMPLLVSGSVSNDGDYTIDTVTAGTITLVASDTLTNEIAGATVTLTNEKIELYTGYVESAEFGYLEKTVTLNCKDRISTLLENPVQDTTGGTPEPAIYNYISVFSVRNLPHVLSAIVFDLLTTYGNLDNTMGTGNTDIDFASWQAWAAVVDDGGYDIYDICVFANGESVKTILLKIAKLTESIFYVGGAGKVKFKASLQAVVGQTYSKSDLAALPYQTSMEDRINFIYCKYGYDPEYDVFNSDGAGVVTDSENYGPSDEPWTYNVEINDDRVVSHNSTASAELYMNEKLNRTAPPPRLFAVKSDLLGFVEELGNDITMDTVFADPPYDDFDLRIEGISYNVMDWTTEMTARFFWTVGELA